MHELDCITNVISVFYIFVCGGKKYISYPWNSVSSCDLAVSAPSSYSFLVFKCLYLTEYQWLPFVSVLGAEGG